MIRVFIEGWTVRATHGLLPHEKERTQRFQLGVAVHVDHAGPVTQMSESVDYRTIKEIVEKVMHGPPCDLLEELVYGIGTRVLAVPHVQDVTVTIRKPDVWDAAVPGVSIMLSNSR